MFRWDSPIMVFLRGVLDYIFLSLLWLVFSLPVMTLGASTGALYHTTRKYLMGGQGSLYRTFWNSFRSNFKQTTALWLLLAVIAIVMWQDIRIMRAIGNTFWSIALQAVFWLVSALLVIIFIYGIPSITRFENTLSKIIKNSILLGIRHFANTLFFLLISAAGIFAAWLLPVLIIIMPALIMAFWSKRLDRIFSLYAFPGQAEGAEDAEDGNQ